MNELSSNSSEEVKIILVGNKNDLIEEKKISHNQGLKFAEDNKLANFFETSSKNGDNINELFIYSASILYKEYLKYKSIDDSSILNDKFLYNSNIELQNIVLNKNEENKEPENSKCYC